MLRRDCIYECGDEDCDKCYYHGILFECPGDCKEYKSQYYPEALREEKNNDKRTMGEHS